MRACSLFFTVALLSFANINLFAQEEPSAAEFEKIFKISQTKSTLRLVEKFSKIVEGATRIEQVDGFDPDVISVSPLSPTRLRVQALEPGVTTMTLLDENKEIYTVEVFVSGDVRHLQAYIQQLFPHSSVDAVEVKDSIVLRGWVTQPEHITEINDIAEQFYPKVLNQMKVGGVQQVLLNVKVMEVQRSNMRNFGFNFFSTNGNGFISSAPGGLTPIAGLNAMGGGVSGGQAASTPTVSFGVINPGNVFIGFLEALKTEGLLKIHAEPILVTTNGRPASLLSGGEFPISVPQGLGATSIEYKQFGVSMEAVPIILGNGRLRLELHPEVSEIDRANGVVINGATVPALATRRVNTQVEMRFGQTLMIAGLINKRNQANASKIPLLGEIPYLGAAFSRKSSVDSETELVILVTPEYVSPLSADQSLPVLPGENTAPPTDRELFFEGFLEVPNYGDPADYAPAPPSLNDGMYFDQQYLPGEEIIVPVPYDDQELLPPTNEPATLPPPAPGTEGSAPPLLLSPPQSSQKKGEQPIAWRNPSAPVSQGDWTAEKNSEVRVTEKSELQRTGFETKSSPAVQTGRGWAPRMTTGLLQPE